MFLLDANVVSEFSRPRPDARVLGWFDAIPDRHLFLSVLTVGEVRSGIERLRVRDTARAEALDLWLTGLTGQFADRIVPVDGAAAERWGVMVAASSGLPVVDGLIAATASSRGWTVATRNVQDFEPTGVTTVNPFDG